MKHFFKKLTIITLSPILSCALYADPRPNFLVVVADDMGFSDLGSFGSEIATPNLDKLANQGLRLTNFYTAAACSPTRSMLLSGTDNHVAGLGNMAEALAPNQKGKPGYEGYLNDRVVSLATRLRDGGYRTYMAGKWHLGKTEEQSPAARGFDRSFVLLEGGGNHYNERGMFPHAPVAHYREDKQAVKLPEDFYSSRYYTDKIMQYLQESKNKQQPFFAYLAYTAPHWPLQAPKAVVDKYRGRYDAGYDALRQERVAALEQKGIIPKGTQQRLDHVPGYTPWADLPETEQQKQAKTMEVYAAMVDEMDNQFGRLVKYLADSGELNNTVVIFMSDNGAEGVELAKRYKIEKWLATEYNNSLDNLGNADSYIYQGPGWATAVMAPFYQTKRASAEGGIRTPAFIWNPNFKKQKTISNARITVRDIAPTLLTLANINYEGTSYAGRTVEPISGRTLTPLLNGSAEQIHTDNDVLAWELFGHRAVRRGPWKLVSLSQPYGEGQWQLFNVDADPAERIDLSQQEPEKFAQLKQDWANYEAEVGVVMPKY